MIRSTAAAWAASAAALPVMANVPPGYTMQPLPTPAAHLFANGNALGEDGAVVGAGVHEDFWFTGVSWTPQGAPLPLGRTLGFETSALADVNRSGVIVGSGSVNGTLAVEKPFIYDPAASPQLRMLAPLIDDPQALTQAFGVSDHGWVAGSGRTLAEGPFDADNPFETALLWDAAGSLHNLGAMGDLSFALDVNSAGVVIGRTSTEFDTFASGFRWDEAGGMRLLRGEGGTDDLGAVAVDLNDQNVIVGSTSFGPAAWFEEEQATPLELLAGDFFGIAQGINELNHVVGVGWQDEQNLARLWIDGLGHDLTSLVGVDGVTIADAMDINDAGQILGLAVDQRGEEVLVYSVLLTPIPEPGAAVLLGCTMLALLRRARG